MNVWRESQEINNLDNTNILNIASVGSVSSYILPHVIENLSKIAGNKIRICFHNYHSFESYQYVANGLVDIALISDDIYYKGVETIPAFQEPMVLLANNSRKYPETVHPGSLTRIRKSGCPGIRNLTHGMISGSNPHRNTAFL